MGWGIISSITGIIKWMVIIALLVAAFWIGMQTQKTLITTGVDTSVCHCTLNTCQATNNSLCDYTITIRDSLGNERNQTIKVC